MSGDMLTSPVRIKGGTKPSNVLQTAIEIQAESVFLVTEPFEQQQSDWIQSDSDFIVSYIESIAIGEPGPGQQFCQTSTMAHPLNYAFKDGDDNNIFTIQEVADGETYYLQISAVVENEYFQISQQPKSGDSWTESSYNIDTTAVYTIDITDRNDVLVCRLLRPNEEDIYLNLAQS